MEAIYFQETAKWFNLLLDHILYFKTIQRIVVVLPYALYRSWLGGQITEVIQQVTES